MHQNIVIKTQTCNWFVYR